MKNRKTSVISVDIAAPINPKYGIKAKFKITLNAAVMPWEYILCFCLFTEESVIPNRKFMNFKKMNQATIFNASTEVPYFGP